MSPERFHPGEVEIQQRTGERDRAVLNSRAIAGVIPPGARAFVGEQRYCVFGSYSSLDRLRVSVLAGEKGFAAADADGSGLTLRLPVTAAETLAELQERDHAGMLFIELTTRRRLRVNGRIVEVTSDLVRMRVEEAFPNCPKYIQRREAVETGARTGLSTRAHGTTMTAELTDWIRRSDTFFVASAHPQGPVDVSHRGGNPGFVAIEGGRLWVPDYPGNSMFGTLGNFALNPRAALVFPDFARNLQLTLGGAVTLALEDGEARGATGGTGRWWSVLPDEWTVSPLSSSLEWTLIDRSPFNPPAA